MAKDHLAFVRRTGVQAIRRYTDAIGMKLSEVHKIADPHAMVSALERAAPNADRVQVAPG